MSTGKSHVPARSAGINHSSLSWSAKIIQRPENYSTWNNVSLAEWTLTNPRPDENNASKYYQSTSYISHTSAAAGIMDYIYLIIRRFTLRWKYRLIKPHLENNLLLDVGCGTGHFLNHCSKSGVNAFGVEPSPDARAAAQNNQIVESLEQLPDIKFNVITLWHVLEHVYDLEATIIQLKTRLAENGTIFIAVPNLESYDAKTL
ncbi:MAG: class I SAM-dependent methyltransferase [Bacteroidota bacterium]